MTTWTTERITNLKKLWTLGQPASAIATILGNVTRNAILGKVHRLGLSTPSTASTRASATSTQRRSRRQSSSAKTRAAPSCQPQPIKTKRASKFPPLQPLVFNNPPRLSIFDNETRDAYSIKGLQERLCTETEVLDEGGRSKRVSRQSIWWPHPARAYYAGVNFAPNGRDKHGRTADRRKFNLWTPFAQEPKEGDWSLLKDHILFILCNGDEDAYDYVLNWMAHLFQNPWDKPGVAIVVWGKKRTGKGTVADAIREAVGSALSRMYTQKEHVVGRFAGAAQPPMFNQIEEAVFAKDPREEGPLKSKITDPTEVVELKFKTPYEVPSYGRWWFNSNSPTPVPITYDEERYFVLHVSDARASDHTYFKAIRKQVYHEGGLAAMVHELMNRDISNFNIRKPPVTEHRANMVLEMLSPADRAVADMLIDGEVALLDSSKGATEFAEPLNQASPTWVDRNKVRSVLNHAFKKHGAKAASPGDITRALLELGVIDKERNADRRRGHEAAYRFLPLTEARLSFAEKRRMPVDMLMGAEIKRSPEEELQGHVAALVSFIDQFELRDGEPENLAVIKVLVGQLQAATFATKQPSGSGADTEQSPSLH